MKRNNLVAILFLCFNTLSLGLWFPHPTHAQTLPTSTLQHQQDVFLLNLEIDRINQTVEIKNITKSYGFVPDYTNTQALDRVTIHVTTPTSTKSYSIPLPVEIVTDPPDKDHPPKTLDHFVQPVILPYLADAQVTVEKYFSSHATSSVPVKNTFTLPKSEPQSLTITTQQVNGEEFVRALSLHQAQAVNASDFQINTVFDGNPNLTDPQKTLDIVFVSSEFPLTSKTGFDDFVQTQADALIGFSRFAGKEPFHTQKNVIKVRSVFSANDYSHTSVSNLQPLLTQLGVPFDQIALVRNADGRSNASLGGGTTTLYLTWGGPQAPLLFAHEFGHSFGALLDEYVEYYDNISDLYYHHRNCKEDPSDSWVNHIPEGSVLGCYYVQNLYRPDQNSLMFSHYSTDYQFNAVSQYLLNQALSGYFNQAISAAVSPDYAKMYHSLGSSPQTYTNTIFIYNFGKLPLNYSASLVNPVPWLALTATSGTVGPGPFSEGGRLEFTANPSTLATKGKYQATLRLTLSNQAGQTQTHDIPIIYLVGNWDDPASVSLASPSNGTIMENGSSLPVTITSSIQPPGWKRLVYWYKTPSDQYYHSSWSTVFDARAQPPYSGQFSLPTWLEPGRYQIWAKGVPEMGNIIESPRINVDVKAPAGVTCLQAPTQNPRQCQASATLPTCFRGTADCESQGKAFCCPAVTPYPTPLPTPNPATPTAAPPSPTVASSDYDFDHDQDVDFKDYLTVKEGMKLQGGIAPTIFSLNRLLRIYGQVY